jgi:type III pantothenate kinase
LPSIDRRQKKGAAVRTDVVVDVGNTRVKWARVVAGQLTDIVGLPPDTRSWEWQLEAWRLPPQQVWVVTGVQPAHRDELAAWLRSRGQVAHVLRSAADLPLQVAVDEPDKAGIDRLLNAVAVPARRRSAGSVVIIDAGSAVTVDYLDETGAFRGGAILPGLRLMAQALHEHTALLPLVEVHEPPGPLGTSTITAMQAGIFWAVVGGVQKLVDQHKPATVFLTGGDAALLANQIEPRPVVWPEMTLEGIRMSAERLPQGSSD